MAVVARPVATTVLVFILLECALTQTTPSATATTGAWSYQILSQGGGMGAACAIDLRIGDIHRNCAGGSSGDNNCDAAECRELCDANGACLYYFTNDNGGCHL